MLNAGIEIGMDVIKKANDVRDSKVDFAVFTIKDQKYMSCVESFPESDEDIDSFKKDIDKNYNWQTRVYPKFIASLVDKTEPMFVILDFKYVIDSRKCSKLYFIGWCPERSSIKNKMLFSTTFRQFADTINISTRITAHTTLDVTYNELYNKSGKL